MNNSLVVIWALLMSVNGFTQNLNLENSNWNETVLKAKKMDRLIFLDVYAAWCGPCKLMDKNVLTQKVIINKLNNEFVNVKVNAEKGEGIYIAQNFKVTAFPSYLFIDGNGNEVYRIVGIRSINEFLDELVTASDKSIKAKIVACKLTSPDLLKRKEEVLSGLKPQIIEKKELENGYQFKFKGSDSTVDELVNFIKSERKCCDFFTFNLSVEKEKSPAYLNITGPEGVKEFISTELGL